MRLRLKSGEIITVLYVGPEEVEVPGSIVKNKTLKSVVYGYTKNDNTIKKFLMDEVDSVEK